MTVVGAPAPFRTAFDSARDPYAARSALQAVGSPISTAQIDDNAVTTAKLIDDAVTNAKLADMVQATVKGRAAGAGTGNPTDLSAAQVGDIIAPAWTAYTPTITAASGTFTTVSATGSYFTIGKLTHVKMHIVITTNGTAADGVVATLPNTAVGYAIFPGREIGATGKMLQGLTAGAILVIRNYDNTYPGANGYQLIMSGDYENT